MIAPENAKISPLSSRSHNHIRYPPISKIPARINRKIVYVKNLFLEMHSGFISTMFFKDCQIYMNKLILTFFEFNLNADPVET
ncbi:hypothetical protein MSBR3_2662 [Methanosarcina barkeri 3]|uniref:Uncharacterized protein n=1 Tax=Methanosarcina barkeri 3 TaxID=1434107 RepID=A0A0E3WY86_METBA|nr:hypothetical protein MSBR3_2662 [Methanosarcina barkeri 3]